jgi:hypothetical protein
VSAHAVQKNDLATYPSEKVRSRIVRQLKHTGFENVSVLTGSSLILITYENRVYRYEVRAIKEILDNVAPFMVKNQKIVLIPQNRGVPLVAISVRAQHYRALMNRKISGQTFASTMAISLNVEPAWGILKRARSENSSLYKFDVVVHPKFGAQFGNFDNPFESQFSLAPEIRTFPLSGMKLSAQMMVPLHNELGQEKGRIRPRLITLNQSFRLTKSIFFSATGGYFTRNRYGIDVEIQRFFDNGLWALGSMVGYTGYATYENGGWYLAKPSQLTAFINTEIRFPQTDLALRVSAGQYLYKDRGARVDFLRRFGEVDLGLFAIVTQAGRNGGFFFSVPLFPRRYLPSKRIRISPAKAFGWEYRYRGLQDGGLLYDTGNSVDAFMKRLNPDYLRNQFMAFRGWLR